MSNWHVAMVRSPEELSLAKRLREDGQTVYTPVTERKIRRNGKCTKRMVAAWPGYLLIRDPLEIDDTRFYRFLMIDYVRATLSDEMIEGIRLMERLGAFQTHAESERQLGIGEAVKVSAGLLQGFRGHVDQPLRGKDDSVRIAGGDFARPVWVPSALILPDSSVQ